MRVRSTVLAALGAATLLATSACGGSSGDSSGSSSGGSGGGGGGPQIGIILPDTESSVRWESFDRPILTQAFQQAGINAVIQNAQGDASRMQTIADQMITQGVAVLAIVNLDSASGAAIESRAQQAGVQTIDYDRLTLNGSADYYISFDNTQVGVEQGQGLAQCLGSNPANIAYLNGSPTDNNATLFSQGAHSVLDPMSQYTVVSEQAVPDWDNQQAATIFEQQLTQAGGQIAGVVAANDGLAQSVISILGRNNRAGQVAVTGQDATTQGLQNILAGTQCMTVYKPVQDEANALVEVATALVNGDTPDVSGTVHDSEGDRDVKADLQQPQAIFRDNVKDVVDDGFVSAADLCTGARHAGAGRTTPGPRRRDHP